MYKILLTVLIASVLIACPSKKKPKILPTDNATVTFQDNTTLTVPMTIYPIDGLATPESVLVDDNDNIWVANIGEGGPGTLNNGFITKFDIAKHKVEHFFKDKMNDPKGFAFLDENTIIVSDHPEIRTYNISNPTDNYTSMCEIPGGAGFLNDLVVLNDPTSQTTRAIVSDTGKGTMIGVLFDPISKEITLCRPLTEITAPKGLTNIVGINGLVHKSDTDELYAVLSTFGGGKTKGAISKTKVLGTGPDKHTLFKSAPIGMGGLDGIQFIGEDKLIVSDWGGEEPNTSKLFIYDISTGNLEMTISGNITSAADIFVKGNIVYIPEFTKNQIISIDLTNALK